MIPHDNGLTGFVHAFDLEQIQCSIEKFLPFLGPLSACRIDRFRYRSGERATFLYEIETAAGRSFVTAHLDAGGKARRAFSEAQARNDVLTAFDSDLCMLLEAYPRDRKLKFDALLCGANHDELLAVVRAHLKSAERIAVTSTTLMRLRPRLSAVFKVSLAVDSGPARAVYVKFSAAPGGAAAAIPQSGGPYWFLRPLGTLTSANAAIWPEMTGSPLTAPLLGNGDLCMFNQAAEALASFHASRQALVPVAAAAEAAQECRRHGRLASAILPQLLDQIEYLARIIPQAFDNETAAPVHGDMKPEHLFPGQSAVGMIDAEGAVLSDPALDIGNMLARLHAGGWLYGAGQQDCRAAMRAFLAGCGAHDERRTAAGFALGKMKTATYAITHQAADWIQQAKHEIRSAVTALEQAEIPLAA